MKSKVRNILHCVTLKITLTTIMEVSCKRLHVCDTSPQLMDTSLEITDDLQLNENSALQFHWKGAVVWTVSLNSQQEWKSST